MQSLPSVYVYFVFFVMGGISALLIRRLIFKNPAAQKNYQENSSKRFLFKEKTSAQLIPLMPSFVSKKNSLLYDSQKNWYRLLHSSLGGDYVVIPGVKLSRLIAAPKKTDEFSDLEYRSLLSKLRTLRVDFVLCTAVTLKIVAAIRLTDSIKISEPSEEVSYFLKQANLTEIILENNRQYTTEEIRNILTTKMLPAAARTLPIAV